MLGTSARDRRIPWPLLDPRECATTSLEHIQQGGEVALVFGREYAGLTNEELQRCQFHVHIPANPEFSSLNLATAVQVLVYEVRMAWLAVQGQPTKQEKVESTAMLNSVPVTSDELERFYAHLGRPWWISVPRSAETAPPDVAPAPPVRPQRRQQAGDEYPAGGILTETQKAARGELSKQMMKMFERVREDIQSVFHRDPAARNAFEVLTCYPGLHAVWFAPPGPRPVDVRLEMAGAHGVELRSLDDRHRDPSGREDRSPLLH